MPQFSRGLETVLLTLNGRTIGSAIVMKDSKGIRVLSTSINSPEAKKELIENVSLKGFSVDYVTKKEDE